MLIRILSASDSNILIFFKKKNKTKLLSLSFDCIFMSYLSYKYYNRDTKKHQC